MVWPVANEHPLFIPGQEIEQEQHNTQDCGPQPNGCIEHQVGTDTPNVASGHTINFG